MQNVRSDPMSAFEKTELQSTIRDMIDDPQLTVSITLRALTSQTIDHETGIVTPTNTTDAIGALRRTVSASEVENSGGDLEDDDRVYLIDAADITKSRIQIVDQVIEGTDVLGVIKYAADPLDMTWQIFARLEDD